MHQPQYQIFRGTVEMLCWPILKISCGLTVVAEMGSIWGWDEWIASNTNTTSIIDIPMPSPTAKWLVVSCRKSHKLDFEWCLHFLGPCIPSGPTSPTRWGAVWKTGLEVHPWRDQFSSAPRGN